MTYLATAPTRASVIQIPYCPTNGPPTILYGPPTGPATTGLLQRRHVEPVYCFRIGKESNRLEEVEQGQVRTLDEVQEIFEHPRRTAWEEVYLPLLATIPARQLEAETGIRE